VKYIISSMIRHLIQPRYMFRALKGKVSFGYMDFLATNEGSRSLLYGLKCLEVLQGCFGVRIGERE